VDPQGQYVNLQCLCTGQTLTKDEANSEATYLVQGQAAKIRFVFGLSTEWADLTLYARFRTDIAGTYDALMNSEYEAVVPHEITDYSGQMEMCIRGENDDGYVMTSTIITYTIEPTIDGDGGEPEPPTATILTQVLAAAESASTNAAAAATATTNANAATTAANTAATAANTAADKANTAAAQAAASTAELKRYGVQFPSGGSNVGTRLWDAVGMTSTPTFGSTAGTSSFDETAPFAHRRCNVKDGQVVAYQSYPTYDEYGGNGDVFEEFNNPYLYISDDETIFGVSMYKWSDDWFRAVVNPDGTEPDRIYIGAYKMSIDSDGKGRSIAGVFPTWGNFQTHMVAAQKTGSDYHTGPSWYDTWKQVMTAVEYASRNCQDASGMQGFSGGLYSQTSCKTTAAVTSSNVIPVDKPGSLVVGQTVNFCTGWISSDKVTYRIVEAIDTDNLTITISGDPVTLDSGLTVYNMDWKCGHTLDISGDTGQLVKSNKYGMKYRGIEDAWGGSAEDICDLRTCLDEGDGATTYRTFKYCPDPRLAGYADAGNDYYIKTPCLMPASEGWAKSFQGLEGYPNVRLVKEVGASSSTYYSDYHWHNTSGVRAVRSGDSWSAGSGLGVSYRLCGSAASASTRYFCARLFFTR